METRIIEAMASPRDLEMLFQENTEEFLQAFPAVISNYPDSVILQVWQERLHYQNNRDNRQAPAAWSLRNIATIILLIAIAGTTLKLPDLFDSIDEY